MPDILPERYKGVFENIHTGTKKKIKRVETKPDAAGGYVITFEDGTRWCMNDFSNHWKGEFA